MLLNQFLLYLHFRMGVYTGFTTTPFFRSPFTDLTGALVNAQHYDKCGPMEMRMMECFEAYGTALGEKKCVDLVDDFTECYNMRKQQLRTTVSSY